MDGVIIPQVACTKFLGLWIDEKLNWQTHTTKLIQKVTGSQHLLRLSQNMLNIHKLKMLYYAQIFSHINYGIGIWGDHVNKQTLKNCRKYRTSA